MKHLLISLAAALLANQAAAAGYHYVGAAGGESRYSMDSWSTELTRSRDDAYKIFGGMELAPLVGVEMGYASLGMIEGHFEGVPMRFRTDTLYVAVAGTFPLYPGVALTGKLGSAGSTTRVDMDLDGETYHEQTESSSPMIGVGIRIDLGSHAALVADYEYFGRVAESDESEQLRAGMVSVGLRVAF